MLTVNRPPVTNLDATDTFVSRHIGPRPAEVDAMLAELGASTLDELIDLAVPAAIRTRNPLRRRPGKAERDVMNNLKALAAMNEVHRSYIVKE